MQSHVDNLFNLLTSYAIAYLIHPTATKHGAETMQSSKAKKASLEDWHPADIIAALRKAGYTLSKLAFEHGLKDSSGFSKAMVMSFPLGEKRIAEALGVHPMTIWPSRYEEDGTRKPAGIRAIQCTAAMRECNGNNLRSA